ncbi:MBL fold metallo-hydrolase [Neobacillus bataviensis]|uniref:MBL fold metallo-hydrolase n=1 Tax=Neobacillus bataviensis TaxID=220685 RepID=UPI0005902881
MYALNELKKSCCEVFPIIIPDRSSLKSVNFYLVKQEHSLSLIDAGWDNDECWNGLIDTLNRNGFTLKDITEILLTHHHIDHVGLVNRITSEHSIPIYAHPDSIPRLKRDKLFLEMRVEFYAQLYKEMGCGANGEQHVAYLKKAIGQNKHKAIQADISKIIDDSLFNFTIVEVPGHSPDQIAFYHKEQNWLFAGDLLIEHISSNALVEPDLAGNRIPTLLQHIDSLKKCLALPVNLVFSGHGTTIGKPHTLIEKRLERTQEKADRIIQLITSGCSTGSKIAQSYYNNTYYEQFSLVMSEIIGHLDYLEVQGRINKEFINGVWDYSITGK